MNDNILEPNFNGLPKPTDWNKVIIPLQQANEKEFRGATLPELGANLKIEMSVNAQRVPSVPPGALVAGPADREVFMEIKVHGSWTWKTDPPLTNAQGDISTFWWDKSDWKKNDGTPLPKIEAAANVIKGGVEATSQDAVYKFVDPIFSEGVIDYTPFIITGKGFDSSGNEVISVSSAIVKDMPITASKLRIYIANSYADSLIKYFFKNSEGVIVGSGGFNNTTMNLMIPATATTLSFTLYRASGPLKPNFYVAYNLIENTLVEFLMGRRLQAKELAGNNYVPTPTNNDNAVNLSYFNDNALKHVDIGKKVSISIVNKLNLAYRVIGKFINSDGSIGVDITPTNHIIQNHPVGDMAGKAIAISGLLNGTLKKFVTRDIDGVPITLQGLDPIPKFVVIPINAVTFDMTLRRTPENINNYQNVMINLGNVVLPYEPYSREVIDSLSGIPIEGAENKGEAYDQPLNTFNDVEFGSVRTNLMKTTTWSAELPEGSGLPPSEVNIGDAWIDTDSDTIKVRRS